MSFLKTALFQTTANSSDQSADLAKGEAFCHRAVSGHD